MNAPKNPEGKWLSYLGDSDEVDEGAAGAAADAVGGFWEGADDEAALAKEAPRALKENPYEVGSVGACGATEEDCVR